MARPRDPPAIEPGTVLSEFTRHEAAELATRWLEVFGRDRFGINTGAFLWHVFSYGRTPSLALGAAWAAYEQQACRDYVVLSNERDAALVTDQRPTRTPFRDALVFPRNFAWTMALTHEDGWLGPYFARHPQHERLDAENAAGMKKARAIEQARLKGWR